MVRIFKLLYCLAKDKVNYTLVVSDFEIVLTILKTSDLNNETLNDLMFSTVGNPIKAYIECDKSVFIFRLGRLE